MKKYFRSRFIVACVLVGAGCFTFIANASAQNTALPMDWQATEKISTYSITGQSGAELYASIGEHGPKLGGKTSVVAYTDFKLTWTRKYVPQGNACTLVSARPKLIITYRLPKPKQLSSATRKKWESFIASVQAHEKVHGDFIKEMVRKIEIASVGLSVADDPGCRKIRTELTRRLGELSQEQRQKSRDFDRSELSQGGNIHQLILQLVNG